LLSVDKKLLQALLFGYTSNWELCKASYNCYSVSWDELAPVEKLLFQVIKVAVDVTEHL